MASKPNWMRPPPNEGPPPDEDDDDWTSDPTPPWSQLLHLMRHRADHLLRVTPMEDAGFFGGMIEALTRLTQLEATHGAPD